MRSIITALIATAAVAAPFGPPSSGSPSHGAPGHHGPPSFFEKPTTYFLDADAEGASVVALSVGKDGKVSNPVRTSTGGNGAYAVNASGDSNQADPLVSQGSIIVVDDLLFTVNAGSNTVVMFKIDHEDPVHPKMVGRPVDTQGEFPMSVTYSSQLQKVCVLNGGAVSGVACYEVNPFHGLVPVGGLRSLGPALNQTTPPSAPPLSASEIIFTPDSDAVLALIKGDAASPAKPGWVVAYAIEDGAISQTPVYTALDDVPMLFGSVFLADGTLFSSDPSFGGAFITIGKDLKATVKKTVKVESQKAVCWAAYDHKLSTAYLIDAGADAIYKVDSETGVYDANITVTTSNATAAGPGVFDTIVSNNIAYSLAGEPGIVVVDLTKGEQIQFLDLSSFGSRQGWTGMAIYA
ncbi:hypothetical protein K431DRAFT_263795 [Polychaeton citri CBS 116435]|uniref:3-carboxymuconate cyclase n=1 Tax=Polychaeton citri CBS 116435 TaxID=1314669 RepID=A0A9P4USR6_9PEZI|nr:hypothetical protein K431DRAFT_263795 [Polychaeton citri CBS 116435]